MAMQTMPYVMNAESGSGNVNVSTFDNSDWGSALPAGLQALPTTFVQDAAAGTLPPLSFIEPRYFNDVGANPLPPNSNHPGASSYGLKNVIGVSNTNPPIDVASCEHFLRH